MRVDVRIKRILVNMERFQYTQGEDSQLGKIHGIYDNNPENDSLYICENGIYWYVDEQRKQVEYANIVKITLEEQKLSDHIAIKCEDTEDIILLPVRGQYGKFADILSFSRFMSRVVSDLINFPRQG